MFLIFIDITSFFIISFLETHKYSIRFLIIKRAAKFQSTSFQNEICCPGAFHLAYEWINGVQPITCMHTHMLGFFEVWYGMEWVSCVHVFNKCNWNGIFQHIYFIHYKNRSIYKIKKNIIVFLDIPYSREFSSLIWIFIAEIFALASLWIIMKLCLAAFSRISANLFSIYFLLR